MYLDCKKNKKKEKSIFIPKKQKDAKDNEKFKNKRSRG